LDVGEIGEPDSVLFRHDYKIDAVDLGIRNFGGKVSRNHAGAAAKVYGCLWTLDWSMED